MVYICPFIFVLAKNIISVNICYTSRVKFEFPESDKIISKSAIMVDYGQLFSSANIRVSNRSSDRPYGNRSSAVSIKGEQFICF